MKKKNEKKIDCENRLSEGPHVPFFAADIAPDKTVINMMKEITNYTCN